MTVKMKDIAQEANVSLATVSFALNNKPGISEATRSKILKIAENLGYKPLQRNFAIPIDRGTIQFIQIVRHGHTLNQDHKVFIADYIDGILLRTRTLPYKVEIKSFHATPTAEIIARLKDQTYLSGAIILGTELGRGDVLAFMDCPIPVVFLDTFLEYVPLDFVDMNNADSVFLVLEHLIDKGHDEIGIVRSSVQTRNFWLRDKAFREGLEFFGKSYDEKLSFDVDSTMDGAYKDMKKILNKGVQLPSALFCINDAIAFGVLKALKENGNQIPEDVSIIGFDDLPASAVLEPPLTSVIVSKQEIGSVALSRLNTRIENKNLPPAKIVIGGRLIERESVLRKL
ncbi:hypothetical protein S1OALGB6SA_498 [Olavius algarvensis spirochete endosymbiont]|uniref:LacI family DNA-binding transcriptional regulator n=1 Tax=Olavius algarvensis spirochete endosymbiont TaxID=260710 RepID=UPI000F0D7209|nr:LacI family DNA-binding transcriptional regulator [Olavius algarvensis spirochete endosymbiont]VDA99430.1 hypothetical protein S1OALGB6SA_498 [Olavius algarvensis spirochete endosymbiont]